MRRPLVLIAAGVLVATLALPGAAAAGAAADSNRPVEYLALGDSLAFGYSPFANPADADNFVGYPDFVAESLRDILTNASCPGETSGHFVDLAAEDRGCEQFRFVYHFPLHADYTSGTQLAFATGFLADHPKTQLVTIDIGANDVSNLRDSCAAAPDVTGCVLAGLPATLGTLAHNLDTIYGELRSSDGPGYHHKLVALTIYSTDYADPVFTGVVAAMNDTVSRRTLAWGGIVADGFGAFGVAAAPFGGDTCAAGLLLPKPGGTCDEHPSEAGHRLLAQAIVQALRTE